jgi:ABC-type transporter Mla MlaB component
MTPETRLASLRPDRGEHVYDNGVLRITRTASRPGLALAGEIDKSTYATLVKTLDDITRDQREVHIDLAGVVYCDLAGLRAIVRLTAANGAGAVRLVHLHDVPPQLRAVLEIIGWDTIPGLAVNGPG